MDCPFCDHPKTHKQGRTNKGSQRFRYASCGCTFTETFDTLYYRRQVTPEQVETILQAHAEGSSLRGLSRIGKCAYGTVVSIVNSASQRAQQVHNEEIRDVDCDAIFRGRGCANAADEMWSFVKKTKKLLSRRIRVWRRLDWREPSQGKQPGSQCPSG